MLLGEMAKEEKENGIKGMVLTYDIFQMRQFWVMWFDLFLQAGLYFFFVPLTQSQAML